MLEVLKKQESNVVNIERQAVELQPFTLLLSIRKRYLLFLSLLILAITASVVSYYLTPPQFESRVVVIIPKITDDAFNVFPNVASVTSSFIEKYDVTNARRSTRKLPYINSVHPTSGAYVKDSDAIAISARGTTIGESEHYLTIVAKQLVEELNLPLTMVKKNWTDYLDWITRESISLEGSIKDLETKTANLSGENVAFHALLTLEQAKARDNLSEMRSKLAATKRQLVIADTYAASILVGPSPVFDGKPVTPRFNEFLFFGVFFGLFLACVGILAAECLPRISIFKRT